MKLYELDKLIAEFDWDIDPETGEILNADALDQLNMERDEKIENICCYIKNMRADEDALKAEEESLAKRRKAIHNRADSLERYVENSLKRINADGKVVVEKFHSIRADINWRRSTKVDVDESILPKKYFTKTITYKPDKKTIGNLLKAGKKIKGARQIDSFNMHIN